MKSMERKLLCQLFTATSCSTLSGHALKFARLLSIQFCSSRYWAMRVSCLVLTSRRSRDWNPRFSAADDAGAGSVVFIFIQINTLTSGKCQCIKGMFNFIYIVQCKWYVRLKISVQGPFKGGTNERRQLPWNRTKIYIIVFYVQASFGWFINAYLSLFRISAPHGSAMFVRSLPTRRKQGWTFSTHLTHTLALCMMSLI